MKYFSMFSGIGGFEYGLKKSEHYFECIGYSEVDKYAESIYKRNFPDHIGFGDATKIRTGELPDFEFLVGGFPCQAFSVAGKRKGFDDARGTLFFEIARILRDKKPRYFLLENVKGLLSHDKGQTFQTILEVIDELGYNVSWSVYNSKDYGVPQNRERIFLRGYSRKGCGGEIFSQTRESGKVTNEMKINRFHHGKRQGESILYGSGLCSTLTASGGNSGNRTFIYIKDIDGYRVRKLTPKECERLQGFPDNWTKYGVNGELMSDNQRYKCCGNAVTTNVITAIVNEMFDKN